jgi:hypothetical protein
MIILRLLIACAMLFSASCGSGGGIGSDGGVSGTGIAAVTGNVAEVTGTQSDLSGIRVEIAGTDLASETDANGFFALSGEFDGPVTLIFSRAADGLVAQVDVQVPGGGTLQLDDLTLDGASGQAQPMRREVHFRGRVDGADCAGARLFVVSRFETRRLVFTIRLDRMVLRGSLGRPVRCEDLVPGTGVEVTGVVLEDQSIADGTLEVLQVDPTPTPTPARPTPVPTRDRPDPTPTATRVDLEPTRVQPTPTQTRLRDEATPTSTRRPSPVPTGPVVFGPRLVGRAHDHGRAAT